jgi:hypothetical protein
MATLSVVYPRASGTTFDYDYYRDKHLPLVGQRWVDAGFVGGEASGEHAPEIIGDIRNFTDARPVLQINERIAP